MVSDELLLRSPETAESARQRRFRETVLAYARTWSEDQDHFAFDQEWIFPREEGDRTYHTVHRFHPYFAMAQPPLISKLIREHSKPGDLVADPFCGAGVTAVETLLLGGRAIASDISPLAALVTKVKTTPLSLEREWLSRFGQQLHHAASKVRRGHSVSDLPIPAMKNIAHWFREDVQVALGAMLRLINAVEDADRRDFLRVAFSSILRRVSNSQNLESHLRVRQEKPIPDPSRLLLQRLFDMADKMEAFRRRLPGPTHSKVICGDARRFAEATGPESVDLIVTSPPYGTTSKYTSIYKLSFDWLGLPRPVRPLENSSRFIEELGLCFRNMYQTLKPRGHCCVIYGTNKEFATRLVVDLGRDVGFEPTLTVSVPVIDASKSVRGDYRRSIPTEHIVVFKKTA